MKKQILFALALVWILSFAACGKTPATDNSAPSESTPAGASENEKQGETQEETQGETQEETQESNDPDVITGIPNPMVSYETLDEINELVDCRLCTPGVMGVTDQAYFILNTADGKVAEVQFTVAGMKYNFRSAPVADRDISGLWIGENGTAFAGMEASDEIQYVEDPSCKAARWFTMDGQYVLSVNDEGKMEKDAFLAVAEELRTGTQLGISEDELSAYYAELVGSYIDLVNQRATAEVTLNDSTGITIIVSWSSSAFERDQWEMEARLTEDGLISYPYEEHSVFTTDADGNTACSIEDALPVSGWFELVDGKLLWRGANKEQCRTCIFEKTTVAGESNTETP